MNLQYIGYKEDKKIVSGTLVAASPEEAERLLAQQGYRVLRVKPVAGFMPSFARLFPSLFSTKPEVVISFSRQLALLLESGIDIVTALELLEEQAPSKHFRKVIAEVIADLRAGNQLSAALNKHTQVFPALYRRTLGIAEQAGGLESVLRQIADYMEKEAANKKKVKNALTYPIIVAAVAIVVIAVIVTVVLPAFSSLYSSLEAGLPMSTRALLAAVDWLGSHGLYLLAAFVIGAGGGLAYIKTSEGRYQWDRLALRLPLVGRINHLNELARCCRSVSLLFRAGLPLSEIMSLVIEGSGNAVMARALTEVRREMLKGEGLSQPMAKSRLFLPMMVQMIRVGEETGNLDVTTHSVAESYELEADEKTHSLVSLIQPALTLGIGLTVAFIAISLVSAMYSIYAQVL